MGSGGKSGGDRGPRVAAMNSGAAHRSDTRLTLRAPPLIDAGRESGKIKSRPRKTGVAGSVLDESIWYADVQHRYLNSGGSEQFADAGAGAADDGVLFDVDDGAMPSGDR
jgi:hypothetical protein